MVYFLLCLFQDSIGHSKGYCFVDYATPEQATQALKNMQGFQLGGRYAYVLKYQFSFRFVKSYFLFYKGIEFDLIILFPSMTFVFRVIKVGLPTHVLNAMNPLNVPSGIPGTNQPFGEYTI